MTATAFVLGATGFVGREVVRALCALKTPVVAHVRPDSLKLTEWRQRFAKLGATIDVSAWDAGQLAQAIDRTGATALYILIGTTRHRAKADGVDGDIYDQIDYGLTKLGVEAARAAKRPPRIIYLSSIGADTAARSAYLRARGKAEAAVQGSGLPWVIARPAVITGERDERRTGERTAAVLGDGVLATLRAFGAKRLYARYHSIAPDVLAAALVRLAEAPEHDRIVFGEDLRANRSASAAPSARR